MPSLEQRGNRFRLVFRHQGKKYSRRLRTTDPKQAGALLASAKAILQLLDQKMRSVPEGVDLVDFVLSGGLLNAPPPPAPPAQTEPARKRAEKKPRRQPARTLGELVEKYKQVHSNGTMEATSLATASMHLDHVVRVLGADFCPGDLETLDLQNYVNERAKAPGILGRRLSPETIRKEINTFRAAWN
jgi:hypothetical protein